MREERRRRLSRLLIDVPMLVLAQFPCQVQKKNKRVYRSSRMHLLSTKNKHAPSICDEKFGMSHICDVSRKNAKVIYFYFLNFLSYLLTFSTYLLDLRDLEP